MSVQLRAIANRVAPFSFLSYDCAKITHENEAGDPNGIRNHSPDFALLHNSAANVRQKGVSPNLSEKLPAPACGVVRDGRG